MLVFIKPWMNDWSLYFNELWDYGCTCTKSEKLPCRTFDSVISGHLNDVHIGTGHVIMFRHGYLGRNRDLKICRSSNISYCRWGSRTVPCLNPANVIHSLVLLKKAVLIHPFEGVSQFEANESPWYSVPLLRSKFCKLHHGAFVVFLFAVQMKGLWGATWA